MNNKKEISERRELKKIELEPTLKDEAFPTRLRGMNTVLAGSVDDVIICYLCMDHTPGVAVLHLYLPKEHRNTETITIMREMFYSHVHPWCRERNYVQILVNCDPDDHKTIELFKTFGFDPTTITVGTMLVQGG